MYYQVLIYMNTMWILARLTFLELAFIDIFQHRSPKFFVLSVPFIYCLILLWQYYQFNKVHFLVHGTCHCYQCARLYNMYCPYTCTWTVIVHILKYFHYNWFTPHYLHSCVINTINIFVKKYILYYTICFKSC